VFCLVRWHANLLYLPVPGVLWSLVVLPKFSRQAAELRVEHPVGPTDPDGLLPPADAVPQRELNSALIAPRCRLAASECRTTRMRSGGGAIVLMSSGRRRSPVPL